VATITSLGFNIFSHYNAAGVRAARRDINDLSTTLERNEKALIATAARFQPLITAAVALTPALIPISTALAGVGAASAAMAVTTGAALGAYGLAAKGAIERTLEMAKAGQKLSPVQTTFVRSVNGMKSAWTGFIKSTEGMTLKTATVAVQGLTTGLGKMTPLVRAVHPEILKVAEAFRSWMGRDNGFQRFIDNVIKFGVPALRNLIAAGRDVLATLGIGFRTFLPLSVSVSKSLRDGAAAMRAWAEGGGFARFLEKVKESSGPVREFFKALVAALGNVLRAMSGLGPLSLGLATTLLRIVAALPPGWIQAIVIGFVAWKAAILGLLVIRLVTIAVTQLRLAWAVLNFVFAASPIGVIVIAIAALVTAIVLIATKTTWFQTAWTYAWNFIKTVAMAVWNFLTQGLGQLTLLLMGPIGVLALLALNWSTIWNAMLAVARFVWTAMQVGWQAFIMALQLVWTTVSTALVTAWNAVWNAIALVARTIWTGMQVAWSAFIMALQLVWTTVSTALVTAWNAVWNAIATVARTIWTGMQVAWSAFIMALQVVWVTVSSALSAAWNAVWNAMRVSAQAIWTAMQVAWNAFITALQTIWTAVSGALSAAWNAVWNALSTAARAIWTALQVAWQAFMTAMQTAWSTFSSAFSAAWNAAWNAVSTAARAIWTALQAAWQAFVTAVQNIWNTFIAAFRTSWQNGWNFVKTAAETIWNALKAAWTAFTQAIQNIWNAFIAAFRTSWSNGWNFVKNVADTVWTAIRGLWNAFTKGVQDTWNAFIAAFRTSWSNGWNAVRDIASDIWEKIKSVIKAAINAVIGFINKVTGGFNKVADFLNINVSISAIPALAEGGVIGFEYGGIAGKPPVAFAHGGTVPGYAPGKDRVPAVLSPGEGVLVPEAVKGLGGPGFVHSANYHYSKGRAGRKGGPTGGWRNRRWNKRSHGRDRKGNNAGMQRYAEGGVVPGGLNSTLQSFAMGGITLAALARAGVPASAIIQPEYNPGVAASAGTHDRGGVIDIVPNAAYLQALINAGFAAWMRGPEQGMSPHIHAVLMSHPDLSPAAAAQVASFKAGGTGLGVGGGGGGGILSLLQPILKKIGKILSDIAQGKSLSQAFAGVLELNIGDDDGGGLFGTGIGPDFGPDLTPGDNLGDALNMAIGGVLGAIIPGGNLKGLGKMLLGLIGAGPFKEAFDWAFKLLGNLDIGAGNFGKIMVGMGKKAVQGTIDFLINKDKEKQAEAMAAVSAPVAGAQSVQAWSALAAQALQIAGLSASQLPAFLALMAAESGGNPNAINRTDSNAAAGIPSQGLMQVIPPTFAAYRDPSLPNNILDPLANMVAAANYIQARYGGNVPGSPYALGTPGATRGWHMVGERGPEMVRFRGGEKVWPHGDKGYEHDRRWQRGGETKPWNDAKYEGRDHDCGAVNLSLPITVQGNMDQDAVKRLESELVPKLRMMLQQKVGRRG
jgi:phage-related protein